MNAPHTSGFAGADADRAPPRWLHSPMGRIVAICRRYWRVNALQGLDYEAVVHKVQAESGLTWRYVFMTCMSAAIAVLGLLLSSPAVVIGAMLLSPLMSPILGAGFALAIGDVAWLRSSTRSLIAGTVFAILFCALIVFVSPLQTVTAEVASRTRPSLFDLLVALFSALAGAYAMIRGREGTIVGVAIATALMPPLAVIGFGLATWNWPVFSGALMLYITNLLTIALAAAVMARLYGFSTRLSSRQTMLQTLGIIAVFILLAIPLGISLRQIALEATGQRLVTTAITSRFDDRARISEQNINWDADPITVTATVLTPEYEADVNGVLAAELTRELGRPVQVEVEQFRVGADPDAAAQATLARARAAEQAEATERQIAALADRLALVAGTARQAVLIDRENRRTVVTARPLDGLTLAGWRQLEGRVAAEAPGWSVAIRPPALPLPSIAVTEGEPTEAGGQSLALITWAAQRVGLPVALQGGGDALAEVAARLRAAGVTVVEQPGGPADRVEVDWRLEPAAGDSVAGP